MILCTNTNWVIFSSDWFFFISNILKFCIHHTLYQWHFSRNITSKQENTAINILFWSLSRSYRVQVLPSKIFALVYQFLIDLRQLQKNCITFTLSIKVLNWKFVRKYKWAKEQSNIISQWKPSNNIVKQKFGKLVTCIFSFKI